MQGTRDRRSRHCQHIDFLPKTFETLFMLHTETLFFVNNDQPQIFKLHIGAEQPMRTDEDVDATFFQPFDNASLLAGRAEATETFHSEGILSQALTKGTAVLFSEHGGRHQDSDLPAVIDRLEGGTDGQL